MDANQRAIIAAHCDRGFWGQFQPKLLRERAWQKLDPSWIVDLIDDCAAAARPDAVRLLRAMRQGPWRIRATVHGGGQNGGGRAADARAHITIAAGGKSFDLQCREAPRLHVLRITG